MAPRLIPIRSGNDAGASSTARRRHRRSLSLERLDERILLSSSPVGGTIGSVALAPTQSIQVAEAKTSGTSNMESGTSTSSNWSGYVAETNLNDPQTDSVTAVSGSWVVPTVTGVSGTSSYSCAWVGIDGWTYPLETGGTVEQIGTEQNFINGVPTYYAAIQDQVPTLP
jgi:Peptidase A4 family